MTFLTWKTVSAGVILEMIVEEIGGNLVNYVVLPGLFPTADMTKSRGQVWLFVAHGCTWVDSCERTRTQMLNGFKGCFLVYSSFPHSTWNRLRATSLQRKVSCVLVALTVVLSVLLSPSFSVWFQLNSHLGVKTCPDFVNMQPLIKAPGLNSRGWCLTAAFLSGPGARRGTSHCVIIPVIPENPLAFFVHV